MSKIFVCVEPSTFEKSKSEKITGNIYFNIEGENFPEKGWNDFAVVVLSWWLEALNKILHSKSTVGSLRFMDGPFYVKLIKSTNDDCTAEFINDVNKETLGVIQHYNILDILFSLLTAAREVLAICYDKGWVDNDILTLKDNFNELLKFDKSQLLVSLDKLN